MSAALSSCELFHLLSLLITFQTTMLSSHFVGHLL